MNPFLEILLRAVGAFLGVLFITRMVGKSQVGQLTISDYVNGIVIGSIAACLATDIKENPLYYIFGLAIFAALTILVQHLSLVYRPARKFLLDEPTVVVHNGQILERNMARMRYNVDDLTSQLREKGFFNLTDIEFAIVEPNGALSVLPKSQKRPVTPEDLGLPTSYEGVPSELVVDGQVIYQNLVQNHLTEEWLLRELERQGVKSLQEVLYAALDTQGKLYVDRRQDRLAHLTDVTDKLPGQSGQ
ncbi:YetF domain-containing protein [Desulfothermobacter acidiphilus]|uniref:YetF domain-containing protein n=1 Tax=Desulfothermobacter acidiphilus TaxID=1938353 RepID=UPI003F8B7171